MDIVKAFNNNNLHTPITIHGTNDDPLFRASDVGLVMDVKDIRSTIRNFDKDEKVVHSMPTIGGPQDVVFLTELGLYRFLGMSRKPIARQFQKWVAQVIKEIRIHGKYEMESELDKYKKLLEKRNRKLYELGDTVYVYKTDTNIFKVGSSDNMNTRAEQYYTHSKGDIVYTKLCNNKKVLEDNVHYALRFLKNENRKDWFETDFKTICDVIEKAHRMLEDITINTPPSNTPITQPQIVTVPAISLQPPPPPKKSETPFVPPTFDKFISDCFELDSEAVTPWIDLSARYRLWSRSTNDVKKGLAAYLTSMKYKETHVYDPETKVNARAYKGLKMIPLPPLSILESSTEMEKFMFDACTVNVTGRASCKDLGEAFVKWKNDAAYTKILFTDRKQLNAFCRARFFASLVHTGVRIMFGYHGVSIKGTESVGRKTKHHNRKSVEQVDTSTNEVTHTYDSITHASKELGVSIAVISNAISTNRVLKGYAFRLCNDTTCA